MAKTSLFLVLAFGLLILSVPLVYTITVPDVPEPTCVGGWNIHGVYYPKELGGCCRGTGCCQFEAFNDSPACVNYTNCSYVPLDCYGECDYSYTFDDACLNACIDLDNSNREKWLDCIGNGGLDVSVPTCSGTDCCQYEEYSNTPLCSCSGLECCEFEEFSDYPACTCSGQECCIYQEYASDPSCECVGLECCELEEFKLNPMCSCSGTECCKYEEYEGTPECECSGLECCELEEFKLNPMCSCSGTECCKYEEYADTPLCVVPPTEEECAPDPPDCPTGGVFNDAPALRDTFIPGGGLCRGACGPDCPKTCVNVGTVEKCVPDSKGKCFYTCTYSNTVSCGVHDACVVHDDCYDACAAKGETEMCIDIPGPWWNPLTWIGAKFGPCHCACDLGCGSGYGLDCLNWMNGEGPYDYRQLYSDRPERTGPFKSCP